MENMMNRLRNLTSIPESTKISTAVRSPAASSLSPSPSLCSCSSSPSSVRNEAAEDFFGLLKEWEKLCRQFKVDNVDRTNRSRSQASRVPKHDDEIVTGEFEISRIMDICYGDPNKTGKRGVHFKVQAVTVHTVRIA